MILARNVGAVAGVIAVLALTSGSAAAAAKAAKPAKPAHTLAFDGHYAGAMTPSPSLSKPGCPTIQVDDLTIEDGTLKPASAAPSLQPVFDGFVTDEGFITGHVKVADATMPFEARAEKQGIVTVISGGAVDDSSHCGWIVNLTIR